MAGRPSKYTKELIEKICLQIATSPKSLRSICKGAGMPNISVVMKWLHDKPGFKEQYARAKEEQADFFAEEIVEIAYNNKNDEVAFVGINHIHRARLKIDTLKWAASKLKPKKYGDKIDLSGSLSIKLGKALEDEQYTE